MTIERKTFVHEILIRLDETGFRGAHVADLECLFENGQPIPGAVKEGPPRPLTAAEVGALIGVEQARVIESATAFREEALHHRQRADEAEASRDGVREVAQQSLLALAERKNQLIKTLSDELFALRQEEAASRLRKAVEAAMKDIGQEAAATIPGASPKAARATPAK